MMLFAQRIKLFSSWVNKTYEKIKQKLANIPEGSRSCLNFDLLR